jgi:hypothetical protein
MEFPSAVCQLDIVNKLLIAAITQPRATARLVRFTPQERTCAVQLGMSALGRKRTYATQQTSSLFNQLVGDGDHPWRHLDAERSRRMKVDDKLKFGRLHHRQVSGLLTLENTADVDAGASVGAIAIIRSERAPPISRQCGSLIEEAARAPVEDR